MGFERREEGRATLCVLMLQRTTALTKENPPWVWQDSIIDYGRVCKCVLLRGMGE